MALKDDLSCGKDLRKFLYLIGLVAAFLLIGSYWYMEYYLKGRGFSFHKAYRDANAQSFTSQAAAMQPVAAQVVPCPTYVPVAASKSPFTAVVRVLKQSVVNISAVRSSIVAPAARQNPPASKQKGVGMQFTNPFAGTGVESIGSGIIVTADGYILTNYHVVEKAKEVYVNVFGPQGSKRYHSEVVQLGEEVDLALLKITLETPLVPVVLGDSEILSVGDQIIAIGSPFGLDQTVSQGIVSSKRKLLVIEGVTHRNLIQIDAAINQGNSGGPLVDVRGYVVGINTAIYTPTGAFAGIGFAVPANTAREFMEEVLTLPRAKPNFKTAFRQEDNWVNAATQVAPTIVAGANSPHEYRGPCVSCHLINPPNQAWNRQVAGGQQFAVGPGGAVGMNAAFTSVGLRRQSARLWIGAEVQPVDRVVARNFRSPFPYSVFVNSIYTGSFADRAGLKSGDIIFKLNGRWVYSMNDLVERLGRYSKEDKVRLSIVRNGRKQNIYITADMMSGNATPLIQTTPPRQRIAGRAFMRNQAVQQPRLALPPAPMANAPSVVPKEFEWLGIEMDPISSAIVRDHPSLSGKKGALVTEVSPGSKGYLAGVSPRDIILSINRIPVDSAKALNNAINSADLQSGVLLDIERHDRLMYVIIN